MSGEFAAALIVAGAGFGTAGIVLALPRMRQWFQLRKVVVAPYIDDMYETPKQQLDRVQRDHYEDLLNKAKHGRL